MNTTNLPKASIPQQVGSRYARNVLRRGRNDIFELIKLLQQESTYDGISIGSYYVVTILRTGYSAETAAGVTPDQAIQRALAKHGVTFR